MKKSILELNIAEENNIKKPVKPALKIKTIDK